MLTTVRLASCEDPGQGIGRKALSDSCVHSTEEDSKMRPPSSPGIGFQCGPGFIRSAVNFRVGQNTKLPRWVLDRGHDRHSSELPAHYSGGPGTSNAEGGAPALSQVGDIGAATLAITRRLQRRGTDELRGILTPVCVPTTEIAWSPFRSRQ
jgi:hypothetical protein